MENEPFIAIWSKGHDWMDSAIKFLTHGSGTHAAFVRGNGRIAENFWPHVRERDWKPGDDYPLTRAAGKIVSVLQRDQRLLAMKTKGQVRFVPALPEVSDTAKREALSRIQAFLRSAFSKGHRINKVTVTKEGHVVYVWQNQAYFVGHAPEGPEGFVFET